MLALELGLVMVLVEVQVKILIEAGAGNRVEVMVRFGLILGLGFVFGPAYFLIQNICDFLPLEYQSRVLIKQFIIKPPQTIQHPPHLWTTPLMAMIL